MEISFDTSELEALIGRLKTADGEAIIEKGMVKLAQRGIKTAKRNTPVGDTGQLRRSWSIKEATAHRVVLINPTKYAEYVEYGHRQQPGRYVPKLGKRLVVHWVPGQFYAEKAADVINRNAPRAMKKLIAEEVNKIING